MLLLLVYVPGQVFDEIIDFWPCPERTKQVIVPSHCEKAPLVVC